MRYLMIALLCLLTGCSTLKTIVDPVERVPLNLSMPPALDMNDVEFVVIHKDNAEAIFKDLEKRGIAPVVFALTGDDYKALAVNVSEIKNYILLQRQIIILYKDYYEKKD